MERARRGVPITLTVRVHGDGWAPFEMDLGAHAGAPDAEVELAVSAANNFERHFCFEADTR
jgi:hypothetical protein